MQTLTKNKYLSDADFEKFKRVIAEMLKENPNDPTLIELARNVSANQDAKSGGLNGRNRESDSHS